jgi:hypothetical protein
VKQRIRCKYPPPKIVSSCIAELDRYGRKVTQVVFSSNGDWKINFDQKGEGGEVGVSAQDEFISWKSSWSAKAADNG